MELRFAHLADYATVDSGNGKLTLVGVFDVVWDMLQQRPIPFPLCFLVASFSASIAQGTEHQLEIELVDADEKAVHRSHPLPILFRPYGPGYPLRAQLAVPIPPGAISVPELGDYRFRFLIDGSEVGDLPVLVIEPPRAV